MNRLTLKWFYIKTLKYKSSTSKMKGFRAIFKRNKNYLICHFLVVIATYFVNKYVEKL